MLDTYRGGYLKALLDVKEFFESRTESLKFHKCISKKHVKFLCTVIDAMIDQRDLMMTYGPSGVDAFQAPDGKFIIKEKE